MSEKGRKYRWFWLVSMLMLFLLFIFCNAEPLKTVEYSSPWYLLMFVFLVSGAVWFTLAFREGRTSWKRKRELSAHLDQGEIFG